MLRRHEKDYLLRKQSSYIKKLHEQAKVFESKIKKVKHPSKDTLLKSLQLYIELFDKVTQLDKIIGYEPGEGIKEDLNKISKNIEASFSQIKKKTVKELDKQLNAATTVFIVLLIFGILLNVLLVFIVTKQFGLPIKKLSTQIHFAVKSNFNPGSRINIFKSKNEIAGLSKDFNLMLKKVIKYTAEILSQKEEIQTQADYLKHANFEIRKQKEELENMFEGVKLLVDTGREITSHLGLDEIMTSAYSSINLMMDAEVFEIGLYHPENKTLAFTGIKNNTLTDQSELKLDSIENEQLFSARCFNKQKGVLINNLKSERTKNKDRQSSRIGNNIASLLYLPLTQNNIRLGVISIQSSKKNAYDTRHVNLLKNIALYTASALINSATLFDLEDKNEVLHNHKSKIESQRDIVNQQNKEIMASIFYAKKIQRAILPSDEAIKKVLDNYFILFKPRDVVSGDFYWMKDLGKYLMMAVADCTGHGVPGAFMSMLGTAFLHEIAVNRNAKIPGQILNELRALIKKSLKHNMEPGENKDGMDIGLVTIVKETLMLHYAGAFNPLYIVRNSELIELKGNRQPIAIYYTEKPFSTQRIQLYKGDRIFIFTDGFLDQFGGGKGKKFKSKRFKNLITSTAGLTMEEQRIEFERSLTNWMNFNGTKYEQVDDITVLGIEI